ncbi:MAG: response regulator [Gammaproteobacteria bacterium]|nr:response regulator [Gammaproteobacteria bacterium]
MLNLSQVSYLGLPTPEINVLKSLFKIVPKLKDSFVLTSSAQASEAHFLLINFDDNAARQQWEEIADGNHLIRPIMVGTSITSDKAEFVLERPIRMRNLIDIFEAIIEEKTDVHSLDALQELEDPEDDTDYSVTSGFNVLVVDDSYPVRRYMEQKLFDLSRIPVTLSFAESGEEALKKTAKRHYDLVFLDVVMEGIDGYKVCKQIKSKTKSNTRVVMLTSKKSPFDKVRGTMSGCDAYITKPPEDFRLQEELTIAAKERKGNPEKMVYA